MWVYEGGLGGVIGLCALALVLGALVGFIGGKYQRPEETDLEIARRLKEEEMRRLTLYIEAHPQDNSDEARDLIAILYPEDSEARNARSSSVSHSLE